MISSNSIASRQEVTVKTIGNYSSGGRGEVRGGSRVAEKLEKSAVPDDAAMSKTAISESNFFFSYKHKLP